MGFHGNILLSKYLLSYNMRIFAEGVQVASDIFFHPAYVSSTGHLYGFWMIGVGIIFGICGIIGWVWYSSLKRKERMRERFTLPGEPLPPEDERERGP